jgi:hypothetical protein
MSSLPGGRRGSAGVALGVLALSACAPHVTHGPTVLPGGSYGLTGGVTHASFTCYALWGWDQENQTRAPYPHCPEDDGGPAPLLVSVAWGWKETPLGSGYRLGVDLPPWPGQEALFFTQIDGYWQAPKAHPQSLDWGFGGIVTAAWVAPYMQLGRISPEQRGWFTTQMIAFAHPVLGADEDFGIGWHPSLSYQRPWRRRNREDDRPMVLRIFVSGGIERSPTRPWEDPVDRYYWSRLIAAGVSMEVNRLSRSEVRP